jgi:hypothetical protein
MSVLQTVRCRLNQHRWGPMTGDDHATAHRTCTYCGKTKRFKNLRPPDAHDMSRTHQ